jgi:hypothetical protein
MQTYSCSESVFLADVAQHQMSVLRDDGLHRHVRFKTPGTSSSYFDLITWPGKLCIDGDMGTYVFSRIEDMFEFFRVCDPQSGDSLTLKINPSYWGEKLDSVDKRCGFREFSMDVFRHRVKGCYEQWMEESDTVASVDAQDLWEEIETDLSWCSDPVDCAAFLRDFSHEQTGFTFEDILGDNFEQFSFHYIWSCYAISWGIRLYDESKAASSKLLYEDAATDAGLLL